MRSYRAPAHASSDAFAAGASMSADAQASLALYDRRALAEAGAAP